MADLTGGKAWVAYAYEGSPLAAEHGGPARLLVPAPVLLEERQMGARPAAAAIPTTPGFWETYGYHIYGDPWREQRYAGD